VATGSVSIEGAGVSFEPVVAQQICLGTGLLFTDTSFISGTFLSREWDFGDGVTSTDEFTTHVYAAPGSYTVTLTVETVSGCRTTISRTNWVTVATISASMVPTSDLAVCIDVPVTFTDTSVITPSSAFVARLWDFGDGVTSTLAAPTHSFTYGGSFTVRLTVTTTGGCAQTVTRTVSVQGASVGFEAPASVCYVPGGVNVTLTNTTVYSGPEPAWQWDFGDGITSTDRSPAHTYTAPGAYTVTLYVSTTAGCAYAYDKLIQIEAVTASMTSTPPISACAWSGVVFTDTSLVSGTIVSRQWDFGDGQVSVGNDPVATHVYTVGGTYVVTLTVTTSAGCTDLVTSTIDVDGLLTQFVATPAPACVGSSIRFSDTSSADSGIAGVVWDLGDGTTSTDPVTDHLYTAAGIYTVWLTATSNTGCQYAISRSITVETVSAGIVLDGGATVCQNEPITFTDDSTLVGTISAWHWHFGDDDSTADTSSTVHTFGTPGTYTVTLSVTTTGGCTDTTSTIVRVDERPAPNVVLSSSAVDVGETIYFTDTGSGGTNWQWDFGDGQSSGLLLVPNTSHRYDIPGVYTVTLRVKATLGCEAVVQRLVVIEGAGNVYLPVVLRNYGADLEMVSIELMPTAAAPGYVLVTVRNSGAVPVSGFWVDLYLDPSRVPQVGDIWPDLCAQGKAWYVSKVLEPGETYVLDTQSLDDPTSPGNRYSIWPEPLPSGQHTLYAVVDSYWPPVGLVSELDEGNNVSSPTTYNRLTSAGSPQPVPVPTPDAPSSEPAPQPPVATPYARPTAPEPTSTPMP
jgi:PKD repeat protein